MLDFMATMLKKVILKGFIPIATKRNSEVQFNGKFLYFLKFFSSDLNFVLLFLRNLKVSYFKITATMQTLPPSSFPTLAPINMMYGEADA